MKSMAFLQPFHFRAKYSCRNNNSTDYAQIDVQFHALGWKECILLSALPSIQYACKNIMGTISINQRVRAYYSTNGLCFPLCRPDKKYKVGRGAGILE